MAAPGSNKDFQGKIFLAPAEEQPEGATLLYLNLGFHNKGQQTIPEYIPVLSAVVSKQQYDELSQQMQAVWDALSISPECVCCIFAMSAVYVGLPFCGWVLYTSCEINKRMNAAVEAAGWGQYKMIEVGTKQINILAVDAQQKLGWDHNGNPCQMWATGGRKGHRTKTLAQVWPPPGMNILVQIPGTVTRDMWPRNPIGGGMMTPMMGGNVGGAATVHPMPQMMAQPVMAPQPMVMPPMVMEREGGGDMASQLAKLAELHAAGALTKEEFEASKAKLIGGS